MAEADPAARLATARLAAALAGRYAIERELGRGGMATVYLAQDLRLGRRVAIKALRPELAVAVGPDRFLREIHVAATLNHPNILPLHDSGEADDVLYYVMPYVEGDRCGSAPPRPAAAHRRSGGDRAAVARRSPRRMGMASCTATSSPTTSCSTATGAAVSDFGIAHALGGTAQETHDHRPHRRDAHYMSPEQIGGSLQIDGRSDIYSLGCVLYEMLVGEPPYGGPSVQVILARHAVERLPSLRTARSTVPPALELVVHRAMAKAPADRYRTQRGSPRRSTKPWPHRMAFPGGRRGCGPHGGRPSRWPARRRWPSWPRHWPGAIARRRRPRAAGSWLRCCRSSVPRVETRPSSGSRVRSRDSSPSG